MTSLPRKRRIAAYNDGAQFKRAGRCLNSTLGHFTTDEEKSMALCGYRDQQEHPGVPVNYHFFLARASDKMASPQTPTQAQKGHLMRTAEELEALKASYRSDVYDPYASEETAAGRTPQNFDEAFAAHLEALDAESAGPTDADNAIAGDPGTAPAPAKKATGKKASAKTGAAKTGKATGNTAPKAPAAAKEPKGRSFRPTSDDRKAVNAAAQKALGKEGTGRNHRVLLADGSPYVDFLQGRALKLDADGNGGPLTLNVFLAADLKTVKGTVTVTVKKGAMSAVGKKA